MKAWSSFLSYEIAPKKCSGGIFFYTYTKKIITSSEAQSLTIIFLSRCLSKLTFLSINFWALSLTKVRLLSSSMMLFWTSAVFDNGAWESWNVWGLNINVAERAEVLESGIHGWLTGSW